ncbi:Polyketide synthase-nonribosomal peptide synthetase [Fusarium oxysporum f. sp. cepae]|uniref:Polyketide synthase-nonribosomal peptide synthetase n=1 Tax=Fusarium oxysporum f. sp. cepae TaxID=396571 RepID=A0A3L6MTK1_FUSOX|nr:Polyketide synthase-nonribosomal peptide synthetase [Fusarium oxysporum f. sp. cepae]RKK26754.1 Polyketide synthase-nonribosomal peptide synthetase [Fusarium oxysporum f. sp. cepae]RKK27389.1 Polyketide synthase-nonribosomal peptide synthetase [Fusarium oxysporum f. sp. cepae]
MAVPEQEPIAIIGMACRFPGGSDSPSKLWDLLQSPRDLSKRVPVERFDTTGFYHTNGSQHGATDAPNAYFIEEDVTRFDNTFFNIQPAEAEAIDPQQRLVMETVYDSLCAGGQTIESLRGSNTAVYVGMMCDDWAQLINRDWDLAPTYAATGDSRAIISNRVSYFFDWHGPSMTIDTACSSSLVAVHQGVTALRNGECPIAIAAGANLIVAPGEFQTAPLEKKLSWTDGIVNTDTNGSSHYSKMWDAVADGYARGEGIAAIVMKPLSAALRDGDHIDCVIRGTAVNQDGKTAGLTMPSNIAQAQLIRDTYARAGLDINDPKDRPQFFHAHGTGTPAGDSQESEAISRSFFENGKPTDKLYVGSIKTVIGHTEGAAGLASLIGSVTAMQHGIIPPNLHFKKLSDRVAPFYDNLKVSTSATPWPSTLPGQPRRVSVNSFGFGGTNAHAILEYYKPEATDKIAATTAAAVPVFTPLTISAASSTTLRATLDDLRTYLQGNPDTNMRDLAYTLQTCRSTLAFRKAIFAANINEAIMRIDDLLADANAGNNDLTIRYFDVPKPSILGVFTGQGAQWARMGARLIEESPLAAQRIAELQRALATLPDGDRPDWTLSGQLLAQPKSSRFSEAAIAQPLCTAVQIVLVDLLRATGIQLRAVVGHSSGEIGAAYAAGFLSATTAIRVAHYRGLYAKLAQAGGPGAMMAVGTSFEDAQELCELVGGIQVAARNSLTSITLSGDEDAIDEAVDIFKDEGKFARRLQVDTAYHSTHMRPCAEPYLAGLRRAGYAVQEGNGTIWFSSVIEGGHVMTKEDVQTPQYWADNMANAVLFEPAISQAVVEAGPLDLAIEFGPHPALKGPALDTIEHAAGHRIPYMGLLARKKDDVEALASALGFLWTNLGASSVNFDEFETLISGAASLPKQAVTNLPTYPFDHSRSFYSLTRFSGAHRHLHALPHPLLGRRLVETETADEISWRNVLRPSENSWLQGHALQGQSVFPAMGYISLAVEAVAAAAADRKLGLITIDNVVIGRALSFDGENSGMETKVTLGVVRSTDDELSGRITCHSGLPFDSGTPLTLNFSATVTAAFYEAESDTLPAVRYEEINLVEAEPERLYSQFTKLGYTYGSPFTGVRAIHRKMGWAIGVIEDESGDSWEDKLLVHPGWLDSAIQTGFAAYSHPHDNRLFTLCVPTTIRSIVINPYFCNTSAARDRTLEYQTSTRATPEGHMMVDIDVFSGGSAQEHLFVQFESVELQPFAAPTPRDDTVIYTRYDYRLSVPDANVAMKGEESDDNSVLSSENDTVLLAAERVGFFYLRRLHDTITEWEKANALDHHQHLLDFAARTVEAVSRGDHPYVPREALKDSTAFINSLNAKHYKHDYIQLLEQAGNHLADEIRSGGSTLEHLAKDELLNRFYQHLTAQPGQENSNAWYARVIAQIAYRFPRMHILEIGAGTHGGSTASILPALGDAFSSYTYTDVSAESLEGVQDRFRDFADRLVFTTYDIDQPPADQGLDEGSYDIVLASAALHTASDLDETLANVRKLLRPGGYLVALEINNNDSLSLSTILGGLPGWWASSNGPSLSLDQWNSLTRRHGFSGIDTNTPFSTTSNDKLQWFSIFASQAVDDRVNSLRAPLAAPAPTQGPSQLVIIGGRTEAIAQLTKGVSALLSPRYAAVTLLESIEELSEYPLASGSSVLCLTELEEQLLETRTEPKIEGLKTLWRNGHSILWVTREARAERPYSSIILGVSRVLRHEYPTITLQLLDFDAATEPTSEILADALLRLELGARFKKAEDTNLLWTIEPEYHYVNGQMLIPRLLPYTEANNRYNTYRRAVYDEFDPRETTMVLEPAADGMSFELATVSPLRVLPVPRAMGNTVTLQVEQSLLQVLKIHHVGYFTLVVGTEAETGQRLLALADTAVESRARVPVEWTVRLPASKNENASTFLGGVAAYLLAQTILATAPRSGTVVVHEADQLLKDALDKEAAREDMQVVFTTATKNHADVDSSSPYIFVHEKLPIRLVRTLLPRNISLLIDLSPETASVCSDLLARTLPSHTARAKAADFLRTQPDLSPDADADDIEQIGRALKEAWKSVTTRGQLASSSISEQVPVLALQDVTHSPAMHAKLSVIDWTTTSSVRALVRPIDHGTIFRADGTYFLVGLTGELGQSLCSWMVAHGARNLVLSSRRPKVSQRFIDSCAAEGATIKVMSIDVTRRESLREALNKIRAELPPIIGVANGAMMIDDALFDDMTFESLQRTAPPKIEGSVVLDEFFYDTPLDFFILFTSLANVVGNTGQSAYIMANQFMAALAAHRRNVRGVAGSDIAISSIQGLGYFEHANHLDKDHFTRIGYRNVSEQDFHGLFAEGVLAGRPGQKGGSEVCTGVSPFRDGATLLANPCFSHLLLHDAAAIQGGRGGSSGKTERPRARLAAAKSDAEAKTIIREAFVERLKRILMIPQGESVNEKVTLVEQGVDSIMAVEVRTWFLQEFSIDLPVLKILGAGSTVESILDDAIKGIPADILDLEKVGSDNTNPPVAIVAAPLAPAPTAASFPPTKPSTETSYSSSGSGSPPAISTPQSPLDTPLEKSLDLGDDTEHKKPIVQSLERQLEEARREKIIGSMKLTEHTEPMTFGQKRFWFLSHYIDDATTFNIAYQFKLTGRIRIDDLAKAVESVAQRHEALRTRFFWSNDDSRTPMQGILSKAFVRLETATIESEAQAAEELDAMRDHKWDLGDWVQLRLRLLSLSDTQHFLLMGTHHISMDGHSMNMLMLDINKVYSNHGRPLAPLPDASQARSFGEQQLLAHRTGKFQPAIDYFRRTLQDVDLTRPIELLSFARSQVRQLLQDYKTHIARIRLDAQTVARLKQLTRSNRATSFHGYLAILQALLFRLLPAETTDKLVIGVADANRLDSKLIGSIGNFLNVLPLVFDRNGSQTFGQAVEDTRKKVYSALEYSALPFDLLLDELAAPRSNAYPPVFQVLMDYKLFTKEQAEMPWAGCKVGEHQWHAARGPYDIALEIVDDGEGALMALHMQEALYSKEATNLFLRSYVNILREVVKQGGDKLKLDKLDKWDKADVKKALELGKGTDMPLEWPATIAHRLDQVIVQHPNSAAVKDGFGNVYTYAALDERVESIARALLGKLPDQSDEQSVVGVFQTPSADWIASMIAILRVGAIYLPLDLKVSIPRLKSYVKAARPAVILSDSEMVARTLEIGVGAEDRIAVINISDLPVTALGSTQRITTTADHDRTAYIIFTSGSTGEPKGIAVKHASILAMVEGFVREWDIVTLGRVVLQQFAFTSDGSLKQIFSAITTGGCLLVAPADARGDPAELARLMAKHGVTMTVATPSEYSMWFRFAPDGLRRCTSWTSAWFGGERSPQSLLDSFRTLSSVLPNLRFYTTYGPTEATVSTMKGIADVHDPNLTVPVPGRILPNYAIYIMDEESRPVPIGVPGEIVIGGAGVGQNEYLGRPDATAKQFHVDPFAPQDKRTTGWGRMYHTGDYGRLDTRGYIAIEGRVAGDAQVKVRGFRIELAEIERTIMRESAITLANAVVTLRAGEGDHDGLLVSHVVIENKDMSETQIAKAINQLRTRLSNSLPNYMVPAIIIPVDEVPLTAHGKVDRKAMQALPLPEIKTSSAEQQEQQKNFTPAERRVAELWTEVLPGLSLAAEPLSPQSDFFRVGGNSLLLVKLQSVIKRMFGDAPRLGMLMSAPELSSMATLLESQGSTPDWDKEIALDLLDDTPASVQRAGRSSSSSPGLRILVTGATGSLGKSMIPRLVADERVAQILVLARSAEGRDLTTLFPGLSHKVRVIAAELPSLPADNTSELTEIDVILHMAADRNFWDGYGALKAVNVNSAKALAKLALQTGATLHVLSSGALVDYEADGDNSGLPRPDPAHGYVSSKWVAERYLANAARQAGLNVTAHRPTPAPAAADVSTDKLTAAEDVLVRSYLVNSLRLGVRPDFAQLGGTFHVAPVDSIAAAIAASVTESHEESGENAMRIVNYPGTAILRTDVTSAYAEELFKEPENEAVLKLPTVQALHWVGMAKRAGLFEWFITSQELVVADDEGRRVVSKR